MQLVLHTGVHFTEQDRLMKSLLRNKETFARRGVAVPMPGGYRGLMRDTLNTMHRNPVTEEARQVLLAAVLEGGQADRAILSDANFFRSPATAFEGGVLYPAAARRMAGMRALFPFDDLEIFLAIRNPATLLPLLYREADDRSEAGFWGERGPLDVRWSETVAEIRAAVPDVPIHLWCAEDMPLVWAQLIRDMGGVEHHETIRGGFDLIASIMSKEGMQRFRAYVDNHPGMTEAHKRRVIAAFLDKFALEEKIEEELDMPGWSDALVEQMTAVYDEDVMAIARLPGVTVIAP